MKLYNPKFNYQPIPRENVNGRRLYATPDGNRLPSVTTIQVDYVRQGLNEGFEFTNPNERNRSGCGESFRV